MSENHPRREHDRVEVAEDLVELAMIMHQDMKTILLRMRYQYEALTAAAELIESELQRIREKLLEVAWDELPLEVEPSYEE